MTKADSTMGESKDGCFLWLFSKSQHLVVRQKMAVFWVQVSCSLVVYHFPDILATSTIRTLMALMMEVARTSETLVNFYQTTWHHNRQSNHLHTHHHQHLKSYLFNGSSSDLFCAAFCDHSTLFNTYTYYRLNSGTINLHLTVKLCPTAPIRNGAT
jgi:hypothetical protein